MMTARYNHVRTSENDVEGMMHHDHNLGNNIGSYLIGLFVGMQDDCVLVKIWLAGGAEL